MTNPKRNKTVESTIWHLILIWFTVDLTDKSRESLVGLPRFAALPVRKISRLKKRLPRVGSLLALFSVGVPRFAALSVREISGLKKRRLPRVGSLLSLFSVGVP